MTQNQLTYWANQETARANLARETETNRHNVETETETHRANVANETETHRSNRARENETNRSNVRNEQIKQDKQDLDAWNALWGNKTGAFGPDVPWPKKLIQFGLKQHDYKGNPILDDTYVGNVQESSSFKVPQGFAQGLQGASDTQWSSIGDIASKIKQGVSNFKGKKWEDMNAEERAEYMERIHRQ